LKQKKKAESDGSSTKGDDISSMIKQMERVMIISMLMMKVAIAKLNNQNSIIELKR